MEQIKVNACLAEPKTNLEVLEGKTTITLFMSYQIQVLLS